ncbi:response regulator [Marinobacterium sediminicola]|uniref:Transcriptional regulatory protein n=1 Tax=Marinobacterium sediminicola TaxID=518898 RepID=A0ABY1RZ16_9GAMM|nr:response regulator [Marinobacterium sediminicola]ULG68007.1 response regulator [Marinobacterium sediminicola]SMR73483.1 Response regulator of citrate/malate metabolism [Marinobacterium sediminicola]
MVELIRVVIAEDDPQIAEIQQRFLDRIQGFELVGIAHSLDTARDLVEVLKPELLLLDIQFPTGTGLELLREMRIDNSATDVILITAAREVDTLKEALRGGVFDYILKPLVFERLQEALQHYRDHLNRLHALDSLAQADVDSMLPRRTSNSPDSTASTPAPAPGPGPGPGPGQESRLPKGIDSLTLEKIRAVFTGEKEPLSAEEVGNAIGASRTTARRYLEYLVSTRELKAGVSYGTVGRPERRYQLAL